MDDKEKTQKIRIQFQHCLGLVWIAAWLFTIGFLHLHFWQGELAIVIWPYYLGVHLGSVMH